jgi:hypothetical protein
MRAFLAHAQTLRDIQSANPEAPKAQPVARNQKLIGQRTSLANLANLTNLANEPTSQRANLS